MPASGLAQYAMKKSINDQPRYGSVSFQHAVVSGSLQ